MFEKLFVGYRAISRHKNSPLLNERLQYLEYLFEQRMSMTVLKEVATYMLIVIEFLHLDTRKNEPISKIEILEAADNWVNRTPKPPNLKDLANSKRRFVKHATKWLQYIGKLLPPIKETKSYDAFLEEYIAFMETECEFTEKSIDAKYRIVRDFLSRLYKRKCSLKNITITNVDEALSRKTIEDNYAISTLQTYASTLRDFFRFAENRSWCTIGIAEMIEVPRIYKHSDIPSGPSWDEVQKLIATTEGKHPTNIRDRAILLLLSVYGLRNGEVVSLRLDDIDWEKELISVYRPKQRKTQIFPLAHSIGISILDYLKHVRAKSSSRNLFLCVRAPFNPVDNSTIYAMVARRLHMLGLKLQHYGPHSLRHACATRLLQQNHSLKEIGDYLGHTDPETTRIYAKVDIKGLRKVGDFDIGDLL